MKQDLIERYIYAVTKGLPRAKREDVSLELHTLVEDMLLERCGEEVPAEKDIRVVLTELGTPQELFAQYDENGQKYLIGPPYYSTYRFVMGIVLGSVLVGLTVASLILQMLQPQGWLPALGQYASILWNGLLSAFAIVTILFAFFQHKGVQLKDSFNLNDLPPVPKKNQQIPKWESIAGIIICVVFLVLFVFVPEVFCVIREGKLISLFDTEVIRESWLLIVAFSACGILRETVQLLEGRYNHRVLATTLVTNAVSGVLACIWLMGFEVLNPVFLENMHKIFAGADTIVLRMFANFDLFFLGVMLFALILDTIDVTVKTLKK